MPVHPDPWPGESLTYYDALVAAPVVDTELWRDVALRSDAGRTITAGDVWHVYYEADTAWSDRYLDDPTADVVVSWVVEVNGGTGTLAAAEGVHAGYPDAADDAPTSLGTFPVAGAGTVVIGSALMGAAEVVNSGPFYMLRLACTSGSVDVQQVKLQVWPAAGVGGGWSDVKPSWSTDPQNATVLYGGANITGNGTGGSAADAYAAARDAYAAVRVAEAGAAPRNMSTSGGAFNAIQETGVLSPGVYSGRWFIGAVLGVAQGVDWRDRFPIDGALVEGVDWTRPPTEVPNDRTNLVQQVGSGSTGWANAVVSLDVTTDTLAGDVLLYTAAGDYADDLDPGAGISYSLPVPAGSAVAPGVATYPLVTDGRDLFWALTHSMPDAFPGGSASASIDPGAGSNILTYATLPPYRVWVPVAVTLVESHLKQVHRDDGYGITPRRARGASSRGATNRARAYD